MSVSDKNVFQSETKSHLPQQCIPFLSRSRHQKSSYISTRLPPWSDRLFIYFFNLFTFRSGFKVKQHPIPLQASFAWKYCNSFLTLCLPQSVVCFIHTKMKHFLFLRLFFGFYTRLVIFVGKNLSFIFYSEFHMFLSF